MKANYAALSALALLASSSIAPQQAQSAQPIVVHASSTDQLIVAIRQANKSGVPTTIEVAAKHYKFSVVLRTRYGRNALPLIQGNITLHGGGPQTTVFDNGLTNVGAQDGFGRYISVAPGAHLAVSGIAFANAYLVCIEAECPGDSSIAGGAALANFGGTVTMDNCDISDNSAVDFDGAAGGALYNESGALTIKASTVSGNRVLGSGGAMLVRSGTVLLQNVRFSSNKAEAPGDGNGGFSLGGAITVSGGKLTILGSTLSGNVSGNDVDDPNGFGGAIFNFGTLIVRNSAIIENSTLYIGSGAGIYNAGAATIENSTIGGNISGTLGGGIMNEGTLTLTGVTIAENEAQNNQSGDEPQCLEGLCPEGGGGIWNGPGRFTFVVGGPNSVKLSSTVIARNTATKKGPDCVGTLVSQGYNAVSNTTDCDFRRPASLPPAKRDRLNLPVQLGSLQENGVPGKAHFPVLKGSPLIDAAGALPGGCTQRDQVGRARRDGNGDGTVRCDIGSIEF